MKNDPDHIIRSYFKKLNKNARIIEKEFKEEAIHLFRIDVKKLRAFLRMMRLEVEEPDQLKFPRAFKKMYSLTGKIRDRQLYLNRLKESKKEKNNQLHKTISSSKHELEELTKKGDEILSKKEFEEIEEKLKKNLPDKSDEAKIKKFLLQKRGIINEIIARADYKDKQLHNLRKNIKDIIYIIGIYRDDLKTPLLFLWWDKTELKKATDISHVLGLFNDTYIALSFLKPADIKKAEIEEKESLLLLRRQWLAEKRRLKKEILNKIREIKWAC